jgi:hypothetical protein
MSQPDAVATAAPDAVVAVPAPRSSRALASAPTAIVDQILNQRLLAGQIGQALDSTRAWLWQGYVSPGNVTLLTSLWKSGKTTLVSVLLARMAQGGLLAGLPVASGCAAIFSEESSDHWAARSRRLNLGNHVSLFCRPFPAKPTIGEWHGLVDAMLELRRCEGLDLVVIDPLVVFLPGGNENAAGPITQSLLLLRRLTEVGLAVVLVHHPRKGTCQAGQAARGNGALASCVDILLEMNYYTAPDDEDRRRWLRGYSRDPATPRRTILELTEAGDDYRVHSSVALDPAGETIPVLHLVLQDATERMTQRQILADWPDDFARPDRSTLCRALNLGITGGRICRGGVGRKSDPYVYWLPGKEDDLFPGRDAPLDQLVRWQNRQTDQLLASLTGVEARPAPR